jgi:hypothetical protein
VNLDGDAAREVVKVDYLVSSDHKFEEGRMQAEDTCHGATFRIALVRPGRFMPRKFKVGPKELGRPGVAITVNYLRAGELVARVVQLKGCRLDLPFDYSSKRPPAPPPPGRQVAGVDLLVTDDSTRYRGRELVLVERYTQSRVRRTFFRYVPEKGRYGSYRTVLSRA